MNQYNKSSRSWKPRTVSVLELFAKAKRAVEMGRLTAAESAELQTLAMRIGEGERLSGSQRLRYRELSGRVGDALTNEEKASVDSVVEMLDDMTE